MRSKKLDSVENLNGKLFVFIMKLPKMGNEANSYRKDYYTVKDNIVYHCHSVGGLYPSGDSLETLIRDCRMVGVYDPEFDYNCQVTNNRRNLKYS